MKNTKTLTVEGVEFPSRTAAARHYGLNPKLVNERVTKFGWTLEQALELEARPKGDYRKKVVIDGTAYSSMRQAARELGVAQSTLMNRIKAGISVEEALSAAQTEREKLRGNLSRCSTKVSCIRLRAICCLLILLWLLVAI